MPSWRTLAGNATGAQCSWHTSLGLVLALGHAETMAFSCTALLGRNAVAWPFASTNLVTQKLGDDCFPLDGGHSVWGGSADCFCSPSSGCQPGVLRLGAE